MAKAATKPTSLANSIEAYQERIAASYGSGSLQTADKLDKNYSVISSGSLLLDYALTVGGLVEGRLSEWYGNDDVGKSTLALLLIAEAQRKYPDRMVAYIDVENKLDLTWAEAHGVDLSRLWPFWPETAEDTADIVADFLKQNFISCMIIDSVGAMIGRVEMEKQSGEATVAIVARIVTRMVRAAGSQARKNQPVVVLINQVRSQISTGGGRSSGVERPGGKALKHATTTRLKLTYTDEPPIKVSINGQQIEVAREVAVHVERNKVGLKGRVAKIKLVSVATKEHGPIGVDVYEETAALGIVLGFITTAGSWYTLPGHEKGLQGQKKVTEYLKAHEDEYQAMREKILASTADEITDDLGVALEEVEVVEDELDPNLVKASSKSKYR